MRNLGFKLVADFTNLRVYKKMWNAKLKFTAIIVAATIMTALNARASIVVANNLQDTSFTPVKTVERVKSENSSDLPRYANRSDFSLQGTLTSSIYFNAIIKDEDFQCGDGKSANMLDSYGHVLMRVCRSTLKTCAMEGVCQIQRNNETRVFNYRGIENRYISFFELKNGDCVYGFGVQSSCLDPFYTLAADLNFHRPGEVVYIPRMVGAELPNHTKHNGFFIIRDVGNKIVGANRFDFFSGSYAWNDPENPFYRMNLGASSGQIKFYKVSGETANQIRRQRNYPKLNAD